MKVLLHCGHACDVSFFDYAAGSEMKESSEPLSVDDSGMDDDTEVDDQYVRTVKIRKRKKRFKKEKMSQEELDAEVEVVNTISSRAENSEDISGFQFVDPNKMMQQKKKKRKGEMRSTLMWEVWEEEHSKWIDHNIAGDFDWDQQNNAADEMHEEPLELVTQLLRFQKEWLAWALKQEKSLTRGGILADEMGMGKTIQAIALVLAKREIRRAMNGVDESLLSHKGSSVLPEVNCTLVICPASALHQWKREIERFTLERSTKVLCYQGPKRSRNFVQFSEYDFIITTYNTIEADYRRVLPPKQRCEWCGKCFHESKMVVHLKYYCGPSATRTEKQSKQDRKGKKSHFKVVKNSDEDHVSQIYGKKQEAAQKKSGKLHNGSKESGPRSEQEDHDEVEGTVRKSALHSVKWERIVLDEAHYIKDRRSNTARAVLALESSYKWALSGTPLQNRVGELYSLIRFLQIAPYSYYFCKDCDCRTLDYSSSTECKSCSHKSVRHFCWWNKNVATPIQLYGNSGGGQRAMFLLKHRILQSILLRRTKSGRASDLALPPRIVSLRRDSFDIREEDYYQSLYNESQAQFNTYVEKGNLMNNYAHIFDLLTRLRQAVDHPYLVVYSRTNSLRSESGLETDNGEHACGICHDPAEDPTREEIRFMIERDGSAKGIVFSQFTSFLDLIMYSLKKSGITCVLLEGSMTITARDNAIKRFHEDSDCRVFLISLKAGGVALNLTVASHVFLMDPWWNPAQERQAMDRIHRIGQYKPIRIVKFVIENTIEERILKLQEKKELVFEGTVGGSSDALAKLTEADLKFLFVT
ncbi:ATP-dependent helicase rhp16 isoform X3 [Beta vulgaris subsp. vulgaris]|uniref:ATP-dependent helicase rhp16 isoform X3 n=1 Tax=Beta vulgaris subsp. vulgaris TaxID=3555 RepID=UPI002036ABD7|nr:ATP-dependent helicase rhp16 isoform X3 [Beta vulgaris subsp. vulgaris]